jgi:hypothetical protein
LARAKSQRRYSSVEHLARIIWLGGYSKEKLMGMFYTAYFDVSGKHTTKYKLLTVAGAVAPVKKWVRFEHQWSEVLKGEGVTEFHMTDFASSEGEYKDWKDNKNRRSRFFNRLLRIIEDNVNRLFSVSVELDGWNDVNSEYYIAELLHSPFALAGRFAVDQVLGWAKRKRTKNIRIVFEEGDEGWGGLLELCSHVSTIVPIRVPKQDAIPCQVGDLIAWKTRITGTNALKTTDLNELTKGLESLNKLMVRPGKPTIFSEESLRRICIAKKIPRRPIKLS